MHQWEYQFEWDPRKALSNHRKHGITFDRAASVFNDPGILSFFDEDHSFLEERWITLAMDETGIPLVVCHTFQFENERKKARVRIISARKATKRELQDYKEV